MSITKKVVDHAILTREYKSDFINHCVMRVKLAQLKKFINVNWETTPHTMHGIPAPCGN
jgi:hypothetical protein